MRSGKARESCLGLGTTAHGALITNLAAGPRRSTRKGGYRRRVVMRFHLHQNVGGLRGERVVLRSGINPQPIDLRSFNHRGIVAVGTENAFPINLTMGIADHAEKRAGLRLLVHNPVSVKYLVSTML